MAYTINKSDGTELTKIVDGSIDQISTDLTLIGRNAPPSYGLFINENFVKLLENFASDQPPDRSITGQLWFDTTDGRLKVYDPVVGGYKVSGGTIVSGTAPSTIAAGDIWIDSERKQLYFNDGTATYLAGPQYTNDQGVSGFNVTTIIDDNEVPHTCVFLYVAQALIGIFSKTAFTPMDVIPGYGSYTIPEGELNEGAVVSNPVNVGFNAGTLSNLKFNVTTTKSDGLIGTDGVSINTSGSFLSSTANETSAYGTIKIQGGSNQVPLILGPSLNNKILVTTQSFEIGPNQNFAINQNFKISTQPSSAVSLPNFFINAENQYLGIHTDAPVYPFDVNGNSRFRNNLVVDGVVQIIDGNAPAALDSPGSVGQIAWDQNYFYICVEPNTWKKATLNAVGAGIAAIVEDLNPSLGGNLNLNSKNITGTGNISVDGVITLKSTNELRFEDTDSSNYVGFKAPGSITTNKIWTLPSADGSVGQVLSTNGSGVLSWVDQSGGSSYSNTDVDSHLNTSTASSSQVLGWTGTDYDWVNQTTAYTNTDVDSHLNTGTASSGQVLSWTGTDYDWVNQTSSSRNTVTGSSASIANLASDDFEIVGSKSYLLYKIQTSAASWVRIYTSSAARTADASRIEGDDPLPGAGVIAEVITLGAETVLVSPGVIGFNDELTPNSNIFCTVTNKSGSSAVINVTLTILQLE